jgi:radical SAM protein with 4Fe4S-binding SPASM domain
MEVTENHYVLFSDDWHLRIEGGHGILYSYDPEQLVWYTLTKEMVTALLLADGTKKLGAIKDIIEYLFSNYEGFDAKSLLEQVFKMSSGQENPAHVIKASTEPFNTTHNYNLEEVLKKLKVFSTDAYEKVSSGIPINPLSLTLIPENACATDCIYCYAERKKIKKKDKMPLERWIEIIQEAHDLGIDLAVLTGGDPLKYKNIFPLISELIKRDFLFILPSKVFVTKEMAKTFKEIGMEKCWNQVSIDSFNDATTQRMVGVKNYASKTFESIKNMVSEGLQVRVNCVATPINCHEIPELIEKLDALGVKQMSISGYGRTFYRHKDEHFLSLDQMEWLNKEADLLNESLENMKISCSLSTRDYSAPSNKEKEESWEERSKCSAGRSSLVINPTGEVTLCEQMPLEDAYIAGDLKHESLEELWNSAKMKNLVYPSRDKFSGTVCSTCEDFDECINQIGYCFRDSLFTYGSVYTPPPNCPKAPVGLRMQ